MYRTNLVVHTALIASVLTLPAFGQGQDLPTSFGREDILPLGAIDLQLMPLADNAALLDEDADRGLVLAPERVGIYQKSDFTTTNSGTWEDLPEGGQLWRVQIWSRTALWVQPIFGTFRLPNGARMWVYDPAYDQIEGGFGVEDVRSDGQRPVLQISDELIVVEIHWPAELKGLTPNIHLGSVVHGYKPLTPVDVDCEDDCAPDVNCPLGLGIEALNRGVVRIYIPVNFPPDCNISAVACTGSLINHTGHTCEQYVLTVGHCVSDPGSTANASFLFNYERPDCCLGDPPGENEQEKTSGAQWIAEWDGLGTYTDVCSPVQLPGTDMALIKATQQIPTTYNTYFNGWDRSGSALGHTGIIHQIAGGKPKKVTWSTFGFFSLDSNFWKVDEWTEGWTQGGSSGGPQFTGAGAPNPGRITGMLSRGVVGTCGGNITDQSCKDDDDCPAGVECIAPCPGGRDIFGRFDASWNGGNTPTSRLRDWLDPANTNVLTYGGREGNAACSDTPWTDWIDSGMDAGGNGAPDPGESVVLKPQLFNPGAPPLTNVFGVLNTTTAGVTVSTATAAWPDIAGGETQEPLPPFFVIDVGSEVACGTGIELSLDITATGGAGAWFPTSSIRVGAPSTSNLPGFDSFSSQSIVGTNSWTLVKDDDTPIAPQWFVNDVDSMSDTVLVSPVVTLENDDVLKFRHKIDAENLYGGGMLEYAVVGGPWIDARDLIVQGQYYSGLSGNVPGDLIQRHTWGGDSGGWQNVEVDLGSLAGQSLQFRWRFATDDSGDDVGWWIDDCIIECTFYVCIPCPADFDGDGTVGASDLAQLLGNWGPYEPCPPFDAADFNEDCGVNAADLAQLLGDWGPCE